jgi:hypothetical protein
MALGDTVRYLRKLCGFLQQRGFQFKKWSPELRSIRACAPAKIDGDTRTARTNDLLPDNVFIHAAALVTQINQLGKSQLQCRITMNEFGEPIFDELHG